MNKVIFNKVTGFFIVPDCRPALSTYNLLVPRTVARDSIFVVINNYAEFQSLYRILPNRGTGAIARLKLQKEVSRF